MSITVGNEERSRSAAEIFNSAVAATAIGAAWELGGLDELRDHGVLDVDDFSEVHDLSPLPTMAMFRALASVGIVEREGSKVIPGPSFAAVYEARPLFYWLFQGSGELFCKMPSVLRNKNRMGDFYRRDAKAVSVASRTANTEFFDPVFWRAMDGVGEFTSVVDLGSGSGDRLIKLAKRHPGVRGLGLDISASTIEMSTAEVEREGFSNRISFMEADVRRLQPCPEFADVELLTCFLMGHDLWPREDAIDSLRDLRKLFPRVRRFLLGDTVHSGDIPDEHIPVFTLGFEVGHALMGVYVPTMEEWLGVFEEAGWTCVGEHVNEMLNGTVVFELE